MSEISSKSFRFNQWPPISDDPDMALQPMDDEKLSDFVILHRFEVILPNPNLEWVPKDLHGFWNVVQRLHVPTSTPARHMDPTNQVLPNHVVVCMHADWAKWSSARLPPLGSWMHPDRLANHEDTEAVSFGFRWLDVVMPIKTRFVLRSSVDWSSTIFMAECVDVAYFARDAFLHTWREFFPAEMVAPTTALDKVEYLARRFHWLWYVWSIFKARHNMMIKVLRHVLFQGNPTEVSLTKLSRVKGRRDRAEIARQQAEWKRYVAYLTLTLGNLYQEQVSEEKTHQSVVPDWWEHPRYCEEWISVPENATKVDQLWHMFTSVGSKMNGLDREDDGANPTPNGLSAYLPDQFVFHAVRKELARVTRYPNQAPEYDQQCRVVYSIVRCNVFMNILLTKTREVMRDAVEAYPL